VGYFKKPSELKEPGQWWPEARTKGGFPMLLRDHPLMCCYGVPSWPPAWTWIGGAENKQPRAEIGILKAVTLTQITPADRCYLYIEHEGSEYIGCLLIGDPAFCSQIVKLLQDYCNRPIAEIGSLDLSYYFVEAWAPSPLCAVQL
jgi:hypothetical protein